MAHRTVTILSISANCKDVRRAKIAGIHGFISENTYIASLCLKGSNLTRWETSAWTQCQVTLRLFDCQIERWDSRQKQK